MNKNLIGILASLALFILPTGCSAEKVELNDGATEAQGPAIWRTGDEDTTVYLFGTVHVLPPSLVWRNTKFNEIFDQADIVYFEADVSGQDPALVRAISKLGFMPIGEDLFSILSSSERDEIVEAIKTLNLPSAAIAKMRPWFAAMAITLQTIESMGQDPESGVEQVLHPEAKAAGKELRYFETAEEQLSFMANLDQSVQVNMLMETVRQIDDIGKTIIAMDNAWVVGDVAGLHDIVMSDPSMASDEMMEVMLEKRNQNWVVELNRVVEKEEGVFFVAVGAAHLVGDKSVVQMLKDGGFDVTRLQ